MTREVPKHAAPRRRRTTPALLVAGAGTAAVATTAVLLLTMPDPPATETPDGQAAAAPVSQVVLGCPPGRGDAVGKLASAGGLPDPAPTDGTEDVTVQQPRAEDRTIALERGSLVATGIDAAPLVVRAEDDAAQGLLGLRGERAGGTLAAATCRAPAPVWWFTGVGGGVDHSSQLFVTNTDEGPAVVDVQVHGATGNVDEAATRGITLDPGRTLQLPVAEVAPGSEELTIEVVATRGRVVAHVLDTVRLGEATGREWLSPSAPPGEDLVLAAVPAGAGRVEVLVTNPGEDQALVDVEVLTADGAFVPLGTEEVSVDPDTVLRVDLTEELQGRAAAIHLEAEVPVTGAVRSTGGGGGDVAYAGVAEPMTEPVGFAVAGERSEILVVGGAEAATAELVLYAADGEEVLRRGITAPPSGLVRVEAPGRTSYGILLPRSGGGYAAALHVSPGVAVQLLAALPATVLRPVVSSDAGE